MNPDQYARIKDIVAEALSRPEGERGAYLQAACGSDPMTQAEAESLLAAAVQASTLFQNPSISIGDQRLSPATVSADVKR